MQFLEIYAKIKDENINAVELIKEIIDNNNNKTQEMFKQEILNINYTDQINSINEMIENLKDSYLELSNRIRSNELEVQRIDNKKILDMKYFRKQREKKKKVFFTDEDISYESLENNALYVLPIRHGKNDETDVEGYESVMK